MTRFNVPRIAAASPWRGVAARWGGRWRAQAGRFPRVVLAFAARPDAGEAGAPGTPGTDGAPGSTGESRWVRESRTEVPLAVPRVKPRALPVPTVVTLSAPKTQSTVVTAVRHETRIEHHHTAATTVLTMPTEAPPAANRAVEIVRREIVTRSTPGTVSAPNVPPIVRRETILTPVATVVLRQESRQPVAVRPAESPPQVFTAPHGPGRRPHVAAERHPVVEVPPALDLERLTDQIVRRIDDRIRAYRERLGRPA